MFFEVKSELNWIFTFPTYQQTLLHDFMNMYVRKSYGSVERKYCELNLKERYYELNLYSPT
ncbi:15995_t:CDS:2 [Cetraspora pellucida]|uniref:15995_t:CDS:1 n=1 Tax=Cetraspora pellucida TaxID=1433469 RepID=A0ACA9K6L6_9GLOM|nr:15995_t:CDS:2 [Cetraspora pellucida]